MMDNTLLKRCSDNIDVILRIYSHPKFEHINTDDSQGCYQLETIAWQLKSQLSNYVETIPLESFQLIESLIVTWKQFDANTSDVLHDDDITKYKELIAHTIYTFKIVRNSLTYRINDDNKKSRNDGIRAKDPTVETIRLEDLARRRARIQAEYEHAKATEPRNQAKIKDLEQEFKAATDQYLEAKEILQDLKEISEEYKQIDSMIDKSFRNFSTDTHLDEELKKLRLECQVLNWSIIAVIVLFLVFYASFLFKQVYLHLYWWRDYMLYTACVPLVIALLWMLVYLKNRASKLCIELSTRLYDIHYIEGLMKMINGASQTNEQSLGKISHIVDSMVASFLNNVSNTANTSEKISSLEKAELKNNPYWKFVEQLKEIIKLIKHE